MANYKYFLVSAEHGLHQLDLEPVLRNVNGNLELSIVFSCDKTLLLTIDLVSESNIKHLLTTINSSELIDNILLSLAYGQCTTKAAKIEKIDVFGVVDIKFSFEEEAAKYQLYITSDTAVESNNPIEFNNTEIFNVNAETKDIKTYVDYKGFMFQHYPLQTNKERLNFNESLKDIDRVIIYESPSYKQGCRDFEIFITEFDLWRNMMKGVKAEGSDFSKSLFYSRKRSYFTSLKSGYSFIFFDDKVTTHFEIYKEIAKTVLDCTYITESCKSQLCLMLTNWIVKEFPNNKNILNKLILLDKTIENVIEANRKLSLELGRYIK